MSHSYYSSDGHDQEFVNGYNTYSNGRDLWMTEYCYMTSIDGVAGKDFTTGTIERFISDMSFLKFNYWITWQIWNSSSPPATDTLCGGNGDTVINRPPAYYVLKKIFTNVPPGSKVRKVTTNDPNIVDDNHNWMDTVAFISSSKMVVVFVNPTSTARGMNVSGLTGTSASVYQIATNAPFNTDMTLISTPGISGGSISNVNLAANSVTVIVTNGGSGGGPTPTPTPTPVPGTNLLSNGDFSNGLTGWTFNPFDSTSSASVVNGQAVIDITAAGSQVYMPQLIQSGFAINSGQTYTVSFDARASSNRTIELYVNTGPTSYTGFLQRNVNLTTSMQKFTYTFTAGSSDSDARIDFNCGLNGADVIIDNVFLGLSDGSTPPPGDNLLSNPGFETGSFSPWDTFGTCSVQTTNVHSGTYSAKFSAQSSGCYKCGVAVSPNSTYTLKVWGKGGASGTNCRLYVKNYGGSDVTLDFSGTAYQEKSITFTTGPSNTTCEVGAWMTTSGTFYVDDFTLTKN